MKNWSRYWDNRFKKGFRLDYTWKGNNGWHHVVPGHLGDNTHRCFNKFEKWYARPRKSHQLYWRLHASSL